jgi:transcription initiation factor TFIID TATA-box-binding protein
MNSVLISIRVVNSTNTFNLGRPLSREEFLYIAKNGVNTVYDPRRFHAIIARTRVGDANETVTALIFTSGKVVLTGARSMASAHAAGQNFCHLINLCLSKIAKNPVCSMDFMLRNVVGTGTFPFRLSIEKFYLRWREERENFDNLMVRYDPTIFTGLRIVVPQEFTAIFFISGKFIVTGLKAFEDIGDKIKKLCELFMNFKR